jgi:UDP-galactopyranose mutase
MFGQQVYDCPKTVISKEFSTEWKPSMEPYYPLNDQCTNQLADRYRELVAQEHKVILAVVLPKINITTWHQWWRKCLV